MAGNVALLKHAPNVPQCAQAIEDIFRRAGFPDGVFQNLFIEVERVERVLDDQRVRAATLTGSVRAGGSVASVAGNRIKKTVLELGGSDPFVVMPSADLEQAVTTAVQARMINNGQSCIAAKRFVVHEQVADTFARGMVERMRQLKVGDPMDASTDIGPLARLDLLEKLGLCAGPPESPRYRRRIDPYGMWPAHGTPTGSWPTTPWHCHDSDPRRETR
jgi:succinate-semialdehyde dehydrogenase / glutarate-semialdehyde dehydrogenase